MTTVRIDLPGHVECPNCKNLTLTPIRPDSQATATRCVNCSVIIERKFYDKWVREV